MTPTDLIAALLRVGFTTQAKRLQATVGFDRPAISIPLKAKHRAGGSKFKKTGSTR